MKPDIEIRNFPAAELRVMDEEGGVKMVGHASVFNTLSEDMWGFKERIMPGAFSDVLGNDVRALQNHDANYVLGRTASQTLRLKQDERGLLSEIDPPDTQWARDLAVSMKRGDIDQMSFAFSVPADGSGERWVTEGIQQIREITKVARLYDVSVVTQPAYPASEVQVSERAINHSKELREQEPPKEDENDESQVRLRELELELMQEEDK